MTGRATVAAVALSAGLVASATGYEYPFLDPSLSFEERSADLAGRLTLEEKAAHLGHWDFAKDDQPLDVQCWDGQKRSQSVGG